MDEYIEALPGLIAVLLIIILLGILLVRRIASYKLSLIDGALAFLIYLLSTYLYNQF